MNNPAPTLNRLERLVLILRYYEELTFAEIAKTLGLPPQEVEQIHSRVVRQQFLCLS